MMNNIEIYEITGHIFLSTVKNHQYIKEEILSSIEKMSRFSVETKDSKIYNTDYFVPTKYERKYFPIVRQIFEDHNQKLFEYLELSANGIAIDTCWFQQYKKGDKHAKHAHGNCNFSNVYYVDLNSDNPKTTFIFKGKKFEIPVSEGDIITFPGYLEHESVTNDSDHMKTVISFNSNIC
jgi:hypothetical protein